MILLSMGHDIDNQGASHEGVTEFALAAKVLQYIHHPLIHVFERPLRETVTYINDYPGVTLAAELHFNSSAHPSKPCGCETLYCPGSFDGEKAARVYQASYITAEACSGEDTVDRGVKAGEHYSGNPLFFLTATKCTALILEPEFIQWAYEWDEEGCALAARHIEQALLAANYVITPENA